MLKWPVSAARSIFCFSIAGSVAAAESLCFSGPGTAPDLRDMVVGVGPGVCVWVGGCQMLSLYSSTIS